VASFVDKCHVYLCANADVVRLIVGFIASVYTFDITGNTQNRFDQLSWLDYLGVVTSLGKFKVVAVAYVSIQGGPKKSKPA